MSMPTRQEWTTIVRAARKCRVCGPGECSSFLCVMCNLIKAISTSEALDVTVVEKN